MKHNHALRFLLVVGAIMLILGPPAPFITAHSDLGPVRVEPNQPPQPSPNRPNQPPPGRPNQQAPADQNAGPSQTGVILNTDQAQPGYTLFAPLSSTSTYLIDNDGTLVHEWVSDFRPGNAVYLLEDGHLLRTGTVRSDVFSEGGGIGGIVEEYTWDGDVVWSFAYHDDTVHLHHDVEALPNGNILMIAWEVIPPETALAAGRDPALMPETGGLWADHLIEVDPTTDRIVWEWHVWDHLVQDVDPNAPHYGSPAQNPTRINLNYVSGRVESDWNHMNAIDYNSDRDEIMVSVRNFNEIWVIDHASGDLLYRWGNPAAYGGTDQTQLWGQHDAHWIEPGLSGEGHILLFNNGNRRQRAYSSADEFAPIITEDGAYIIGEPPSLIWQYILGDDLFSMSISGVQRLPNGHTLICSGESGTFLEVTPTGDIVWQYVNPYGNTRNGQARLSVFRAIRYAPTYPGLSALGN